MLRNKLVKNKVEINLTSGYSEKIHQKICILQLDVLWALLRSLGGQLVKYTTQIQIQKVYFKSGIYNNITITLALMSFLPTLLGLSPYSPTELILISKVATKFTFQYSME